MTLRLTIELNRSMLFIIFPIIIAYLSSLVDSAPEVCTKGGCRDHNCWKYCSSVSESGAIGHGTQQTSCTTGRLVKSEMVRESCTKDWECYPCLPCATPCH